MQGGEGLAFCGILLSVAERLPDKIQKTPFPCIELVVCGCSIYKIQCTLFSLQWDVGDFLFDRFLSKNSNDSERITVFYGVKHTAPVAHR